MIKEFKLNLSTQQVQALVYSMVVLLINKREYPFPSSLLFDRVYYYTYLFRKNFPKFYKALDAKLKEYKLSGGEYSEEVIDSVIYWGNLIVPNIGFSSRTITILVLSDFSKQHAQYVGQLVCESLNKVHETAIFEAKLYHQGSLANPSEYQVILSNLPLECSKRVIIYNDYISESELNRIWLEINKLL